MSLIPLSARFYHHLHSRPVSRSASRSSSPGSPNRTLPSSSSTSPIYVRRSLTLPQNGLGLSGPSQSAALSPNHIFLQQHLPPTFPHTGPSPETAEAELAATHPMVILTPTTKEWRVLQEIRRLKGESVDGDDGSEGSDAEDRLDSSSESVEGHLSRSSSMSLRLDMGSTAGTLSLKKPPLRQSLSADFLGVEVRHSPDPGSPVNPVEEEDEVPHRPVPVFKPIIIAPSPVTAENDQVQVQPETPTRVGVRQVSPALAEDRREESPDHADDGTFGFNVKDIDQEESSQTAEDSLVRFASIGRQGSLRPSKKPEIRLVMPRAKTKRELERERLFKDLDENIETEGIESKDAWRGGVQEIGLGGGLSSRPSSADAVMLGRTNNQFEKYFEKNASLPLAPKPIHCSPTHPFKPSPLHSSPLTLVTMSGGLPTPGLDKIDSPSPPRSPRRTPSPVRAEKLASLRDFARSLISPHSHNNWEKSRPSTPSPPKSPRARRRDGTRVSLIAGRVVQPYAIPPLTALPPDRSLADKPILQSFSPFRTPTSGGAKFGTSSFAPPSFDRLDSTISIAPSIGVPSECTTPTSETAGGVGGRGIDDYVILKEAGKGAYGLVMRAKVKGKKGDPVGVSHSHVIRSG